MKGFPRENQKYSSGVFLEACGGPASNAAYLLGLWGRSCGFAGCVGDDLYGKQILDSFRSVGVDTSLTEVRDSHHTSLSWIVTNEETGSRTILNRRVENTQMNFAPGSLERPDPSFLLFDSHEHEASLEVLKMFPHAVSVLDAGTLREASADLSGKVSHLLCSEGFALDLTGIADLTSTDNMLQCAEILMGRNPRPGCFTLGSRGLVFWEDGAVYRMPAFQVEALDTTAAGDIFHGSFVYFLAVGEEFQSALLAASATAALSTERPGGRPSIPSVDTVRNYLRDEEETGGLPKLQRL